MALFDTKQTQTVDIPGRGAGEQDLLNQLVSLMANARGQIGDLSGLASGQLPQLSPDMIALIESIGRGSAASQTEALQRTGQEQKIESTQRLAGQGIDMSSINAVQQGLIDREVLQGSQDIERQRADLVAQLMYQSPFNIAQNVMLPSNQTLYSLLTQTGGMLNENYLRDRLARTTTTTEGSGLGNLFGSFMGLGQSLASAGAFNPWMDRLGGNSGGGTENA
jgi:hypothetical protein